VDKAGHLLPRRSAVPKMEDVVVISVYWFAGMVFLQGNSLFWVRFSGMTGDISWYQYACRSFSACRSVKREGNLPQALTTSVSCSLSAIRSFPGISRDTFETGWPFFFFFLAYAFELAREDNPWSFVYDWLNKCLTRQTNFAVCNIC